MTGPAPPPLGQQPRPFGAAKPGARRPLPRSPAKPARRLRGWRKWLAIGVLSVVLMSLAAAGGAAVYFLHDLPAVPDDRTLWTMARAPGMTFEDRNGTMIATRGAKNGYRVRLNELPAYVPQAFLAAEDRRFYDHGGYDPTGIVRAAIANLRKGEVVQGGSTITQQIAKTLFLAPDRVWKRKVQETLLATRLERRLGKDGVLELYLNRVFFGSGAYGLDAAAQTYFGVPARQLTLSQAAVLAALPKAPSRLALNRNMEAALLRSRTVLAAMREEGWITPAQEQAALASPPSLAPPRPSEGDIGYVLDMGAAEAARIAGPDAPDLIVRLTIDVALQDRAQAIVRETIASQGRGARASQAALVAITPDGAIRALVGGADHRASPFNRATQARRQPGSSFKPFVYAAALEAGVQPNDVRVDRPVRFGAWRPANYGGGYSGAVTVEQALVRSINTVAVKLGDEVGREKLGEISRRFGITTVPPLPDLSVALGAYEVNLLEMTNAFQVFQNAGARRPAYLVSAVSSSRGDLLYARPQTPPVQVYQRQLAGSMVRMMKGVIERGTGRDAAIGRPAAGKTGTSQSWRDAWFVGFTPDWAAGVWVGNDDDRPMNRITGGDLPARMWRRFMTEAHKDLPVRDFDFLPQSWPGGTTPVGELVFDGNDDLSEDIDPVEEDRTAFYDTLAEDFAGPPD